MAKKRINARRKGKTGERLAKKWLWSLGFNDAYCTRQRNGTDTNDVACPKSLPNLHIEVKYWGQFTKAKLNSAIRQATRDSCGKPFCVIWRCTHDTPARKLWRVSFVRNRSTVTMADGDHALLLRRLNYGAPTDVDD